MSQKKNFFIVSTVCEIIKFIWAFDSYDVSERMSYQSLYNITNPADTIAVELLEYYKHNSNPVGYRQRQLFSVPMSVSFQFLYYNDRTYRFQKEILLLLSDGTPHGPIYAPNAHLTFFDNIDASLPTYFIIHGWLSTLETAGLVSIMERLAENKIGNPIGIEWTPLALNGYDTAFDQLPKIADHVIKFMDLIHYHKGINPEDITIIGHSMGAQMAGFIGKRVSRGKLKRIDGLDPAGPRFKEMNTNDILNSHDAHFVNNLHTDYQFLGIGRAIGHADFFPNGGGEQPGCTTTTDYAFACSHLKSIPYYYRSMFEEFNSAKCNSYQEFQNGVCEVQLLYKMGFLASPRIRGKFYNSMS